MRSWDIDPNSSWDNVVWLWELMMMSAASCSFAVCWMVVVGSSRLMRCSALIMLFLISVCSLRVLARASWISSFGAIVGYIL